MSTSPEPIEESSAQADALAHRWTTELDESDESGQVSLLVLIIVIVLLLVLFGFL